MTAQQALSVLDQAARKAPLDRDSHVLAQEAIKVLTALVAELELLKTTPKQS